VTTRDDLTDAFLTASRALVGVAVHSVSAAPVDITVNQFRVLVLVAEEGRSIGEIADHVGVNQSNASRQCDRLQRLGLVERTRHAQDARVVVVELTDAGHAAVEAVMQQRRDDVRRLLAAVEPRQVGAMVEALQELNRAAHAMDEAPWMRDPW
jgi:DNA-binding MarR family transcriptional regulator